MNDRGDEARSTEIREGLAPEGRAADSPPAAEVDPWTERPEETEFEVAPPRSRRSRIGIADLMLATLIVATSLYFTGEGRRGLERSVGRILPDRNWKNVPSLRELLGGLVSWWGGGVRAFARFDVGSPFIAWWDAGVRLLFAISIDLLLVPLMGLPPGLLLMLARGGREPFRELIRRPEFVGMLAATLGIAEAAFLGGDPTIFYAQGLVGGWVAAAWIGLALTGRWRTPEGLLGWTSMVIGGIWIAESVAFLAAALWE